MHLYKVTAVKILLPTYLYHEQGYIQLDIGSC